MGPQLEKRKKKKKMDEMLTGSKMPSLAPTGSPSSVFLSNLEAMFSANLAFLFSASICLNV